MPLINMMRKPEAEEMPGQLDLGEPMYSESLAFELESDELEKLGMTVLPELGTELMITAKVFVKSVSSSDTFEGKEKCVELQITDIELSGIDRSQNIAAMLYGSTRNMNNAR